MSRSSTRRSLFLRRTGAGQPSSRPTRHETQSMSSRKARPASREASGTLRLVLAPMPRAASLGESSLQAASASGARTAMDRHPSPASRPASQAIASGSAEGPAGSSTLTDPVGSMGALSERNTRETSCASSPGRPAGPTPSSSASSSAGAPASAASARSWSAASRPSSSAGASVALQTKVTSRSRASRASILSCGRPASSRPLATMAEASAAERAPGKSPSTSQGSTSPAPSSSRA